MNSEIQRNVDIVNEKLKEIFSEDRSNLSESMQYSLLNGGKRIRPLLSIATCKILDCDVEKYFNYMIAIEMIHAYSLIHDDLPALDNDDFRRGLLTSHKKFGEDIAILTGDALLNKAAIILLNEVTKANDRLNTAKASEYILEAAGPEGMIAGQVMDISSSKKIIDLKDLKQMHWLKTGQLIKASLCFPAIIENNGRVLDILEKASISIGLAFQIKDDILDVEGDFRILGKSIGKDEKNNRSTYVSLLGLSNAKKLLEEEVKKAYSEIRKLRGDTSFLKQLIEMISNRGN